MTKDDLTPPSVNTCLVTVPLHGGNTRHSRKFRGLPSRVHAFSEVVASGLLLLSCTSIDVTEAVGKSVEEMDAAFFQVQHRVYLAAAEKTPGKFSYFTTTGDGNPAMELTRETATALLHGGALRMQALQLVLWAFAARMWPAWEARAKRDQVRLRSVDFTTGPLTGVGVVEAHAGTSSANNQARATQGFGPVQLPPGILCALVAPGADGGAE